MSNREEIVEKIKDALHYESGLYDMMAGGKMYAIDLNRCKDKLANNLASLISCKESLDNSEKHRLLINGLICPNKARYLGSLVVVGSGFCILRCPRYLGVKNGKVMCKKVDSE